jgi:hypothetical protein
MCPRFRDLAGFLEGVTELTWMRSAGEAVLVAYELLDALLALLSQEDRELLAGVDLIGEHEPAHPDRDVGLREQIRVLAQRADHAIGAVTDLQRQLHQRRDADRERVAEIDRQPLDQNARS